MKPTRFRVEYSSNNSGGGWWLKDTDWLALEEQGWEIEWGGLDFCNPKYGPFGGQRHTAPDTHEPDLCPGHRRAASLAEAIANDDKWLGCYARAARIEIEAYSATLAEGVASEWWRETLGMDPDEEGCSCCAQPHSFWAREVTA